jgi:membrane carboxypeptidase/penicillin-binding protein PbpC
VVTPRRTIVVWMGNTGGSGSDELVGQEIAAPLALRILCCADPGGPGFIPPPDFDSMPLASSTAARPVPLTLLSPSAGQQILRDPSLPANEQRLALRARTTLPNTTHLWWFIDGSSIGESDPNQPLLWPPSPGQHEATAVSADGNSAHVQFVVR